MLTLQEESPEYFDILDENGRPTGRTKLRSEVHRDGDWHRAVLIWLVNQNGDILLQRRAADKDSCPGMLDTSVGGHLQGGDEPLEGAVREVKEEIGLDIPPSAFQFLWERKCSTVPHPGFINNCFYTSYLIRTDKTIAEMTPQAEEISELFFVPFAKFKQMVTTHDPDLIPDRAEYTALIALLEPEFGNTNHNKENK